VYISIQLTYKFIVYFQVLGAVRVPLYNMYKNKHDGFAAFLKNNFIGCSKTQLLECIRTKNLLDVNVLESLIKRSKEIDPLSSSSEIEELP